MRSSAASLRGQSVARVGLRAIAAIAAIATGSGIVTPTVAQVASRPGALSTEAIAARAVPATVTIVTFAARGDTLGMGSGFLVRSSGVLITNYHVMAGASRAAVILASGERYDRVEALDQDANADLAILKIPGYGLPILPTSAALPAVGAKLVAVGNPLGLSRTVTEGILSAVRLDDGRQLVQMSAAISPGSSGGPVLNDRGEVVAIATSYLKAGQNLNFAVPVRYAMGLVDSGRRPVTLAQAFGTGESNPDARSPAASSGYVSSGATSNQSAPSARPPRTARPRAGVTGTWQVVERIVNTRTDVTMDYKGYLFLGANDLGILATMPIGVEHGDLGVWFVQNHTETPDGRLTITTGGLSFDGYQTESGFYMETEKETESGDYQVAVAATAEEIPLSSANGLYSVTGSTQMHLSGYDQLGSATWSGEAVVVYAHDSVYVDLFLTNDEGGSAAATMSGPVKDGGFDLRSNGDRLHGWADNGKLQVEWIDRRDWGRYEGLLTGRRK